MELEYPPIKSKALKAALTTHGSLGLFSYAPPQTREMLELTHSAVAREVLVLGDPTLLRNERDLITYYSTPMIVEDVANRYRGVEEPFKNRETTRAAIAEALIRRHSHLTAGEQRILPLDSILPIKRKYLPKEHRWLIRDDVGSQILEVIEGGAGFNKTQAEVELTRDQLVRRFLLLRSLGFNVPTIPFSPPENRWIIANLKDQTKTDEEVQAFLNRIKTRIYDISNESEEPFLSAIANIAMDDGYHVYWKNAHEFFEVARKKVPVSPEFIRNRSGAEPAKYRMVVTWHSGRVSDAFAEEEPLQKYLEPVVAQVSGKPLDRREVPTTWDIVKKKGILSLSDVLIGNFGLYSASGQAKLAREWLPNNGYNGHLFRHDNTLYLKESERGVLVQYLEDKFGFVPIIPAQSQ